MNKVIIEKLPIPKQVQIIKASTIAKGKTFSLSIKCLNDANNSGKYMRKSSQVIQVLQKVKYPPVAYKRLSKICHFSFTFL